MAGGTWTTQNKRRPGVYINFVSEAKSLGSAADRGVVTMALPLSWGEPQTMITVEGGQDTLELLGYDVTSPQLKLVGEALKRAKTLLLYRLNTGVKAAATHGSLTATARHGGVRGNDLSIVIQTNVDDPDKFDVKTLLSGAEVDLQTAETIGELTANAWVVFSGTGALTATAGASLTGGADGSVTNADHTAYLSEAELHDFNTMALVSSDAALKGVYAAFVRRLREDEGRMIQAVLANYATADHEGIISVKNGVKLADGSTLTAEQATAWVAGATAGASMSESLTYKAYDDAIDVDTRYTNSQIEAALGAGEFLFVPSNGRAIVEQDINSFTGFSPDKGKERSKNRVIRVLDGIASDFKRIFETFYIGKLDNNPDGRALFREECVNYLGTLLAQNAIQPFDTAKDVLVESGAEPDSLYVELNVQPVDSVEKIYMKVKVK